MQTLRIACCCVFWLRHMLPSLHPQKRNLRPLRPILTPFEKEFIMRFEQTIKSLRQQGSVFLSDSKIGNLEISRTDNNQYKIEEWNENYSHLDDYISSGDFLTAYAYVQAWFDKIESSLRLD